MLIVWKHNNVFVTHLNFAKFAYFRIYHQQHKLASSTSISKQCTVPTTTKDVFHLSFIMFNVCVFCVFCVFCVLSVRSNERSGKKNRNEKNICLVCWFVSGMRYDWRYIYFYIIYMNTSKTTLFVLWHCWASVGILSFWQKYAICVTFGHFTRCDYYYGIVNYYLFDVQTRKMNETRMENKW